MSLDYKQLAQVSDQLLQEFGFSAVMTSHTQGTYNTTTGAMSGSSNVTTNVFVVFVPWDQTFIEGSKYGWTDEFHRHGTSVLQTDIRCLMSAFDVAGVTLVTPKLGDKVTADGVIYTIVGKKPIQPALTPVLYDIALRA